jgi:hypothetical protein
MTITYHNGHFQSLIRQARGKLSSLNTCRGRSLIGGYCSYIRLLLSSATFSYCRMHVRLPIIVDVILRNARVQVRYTANYPPVACNLGEFTYLIFAILIRCRLHVRVPIIVDVSLGNVRAQGRNTRH